MKTVEHYICEICGGEYNDKRVAEACEKCHKQPKEITGARYLSKAQNGQGYPVSITVKMSDGTHQIYKR